MYNCMDGDERVSLLQIKCYNTHKTEPDVQKNLLHSPAGHRVLSSLILLTFALFSSTAWAEHISVSPIKLLFAKGVNNQQIEVRNPSDRPINIQVQIKKWMQDSEGETQLSDTKDIIFYPKIAVVPPKSSVVVRLGHQLADSNSERTYRIFTRELPDLSEQGQAQSVGMLMQLSVPLFILPTSDTPVETPQLTSLQAGAHGVSVKVHNDGKRHVQLKSLQVSGLQGETTVFNHEINGWYVLAGADKNFSLKISPEQCASVDHLNIVASTNAFPTVTVSETLALPPELCGSLK